MSSSAHSTDIRQVQTWEASDGYGSSGYFGWNMISKRMALYYMTGDARHAREALRLALPDQQAKYEIAAIDGEMIENKDAPLSGPYHYNAIMMVLYWDLIEESPVFTEEERLKVTRAFAQQLLHRRDEGSYGLTDAPTAVGSRHGQWSAMSLYCLGRYLNAGYPDPVWAQSMRGAQLHFAPLYESAYIAGESDNLYWFDTGIAAIFAYMVLTGDRKPFDAGSAQVLLKAHEALITGRPKNDWALRYAAYSYLNQVAYLTGDGRWITYRNRTNLDPAAFRAGQSFWPDESVVKPHQPDDLNHVWNLDPVPEPHFYERGSGLPLDQSILFGSFRSAPDNQGDYLLLDGYNGASRNAYHTFAVLQLRLGGQWVLKSSGNSEAYYNQVLTCADGMVEPAVPMDAALRWHDVVGQVAGCVAEVPKAAFCNWRRTLAQRVGRYALFVDDLTFRTDSRNMEVETYWETGNGAWNAKEQALSVPNEAAGGVPAGWLAFKALESACTSEPAGPNAVVRLDGINTLLLRATQPGQWLELPFTLDRPVTGEVFADLLSYIDRGTVKLLLDGKPAGEVFDHYASAAVPARPSLGHQTLAAGKHTLRVEVAGRHEDGEKTYIGLVGVSLKPDGVTSPADLPKPIEIRLCDPQPATGGGILKLTWQGPVKAGEHRRGFTLIAPSGPGDQAAACVRVADNAAALALPEPAVASVGAWQGSDGELVVLAATHLFGIKLTKAGGAQPLAIAGAPVDLDWDFATGELSVVAAADTELRLALDPATLVVAGKPVQRVADGLASLALTAGRHSLKGLKPAPALLGALQGELAEALAAGKAGHAQRIAALGRDVPPTGAPLQPAWTASLGGKPEAVEVAQTPGGPVIWVATEKLIHALGADGASQRQMATDGPIRVLHYWPDAAGKDGAAPLLLAGCRDDKVVAFDLAGQRRWTFVSEMDPEVFRAAKQYWFKTAPGHEGIHGIGTGPFIDGKSEAFIGSACTLEILNADGGLDKRLAAFWGTGNVFQLLPGAGGSTNLLLGRMPTDGLHLYVINNRDVRANNYGFYGVPAGHTYVGGWASQARKHLFYTDLDGDGTKEVASEVNGSWNRVSVWDVNGVPLCNAQFGPGNPIPAENITDIDLSDLDGDGKQEIVLSLSRGLVVALSSHCERRWSLSLPSAPWRLQAVGRQVLVGCADGSVYLLDGEGTVKQAGKLDSRPLFMDKLPTADGRTLVIVATEKGTMAGFVL
ncbi:MAG: VCBS repeat-containing protein [Armatimonadetes bacterium]|nr:VCBS repeat-containing protein [Armatimonadota bacterium]